MDTKTKILDSAEAAVRRYGYDGFSYADLAETVGIRKASIHYHFPTKADLGLALVDRYSRNFFGVLDRIIVSHDTAGSKLEAYIAACRNSLDGGTKLCLCVALCLGTDSLSGEMLDRLNAFHTHVTTWLRDIFSSAAVDGSIKSLSDAEHEAQACLAQMEGAQLIARAAQDVSRFDLAVSNLAGRLR